MYKTTNKSTKHIQEIRYIKNPFKDYSMLPIVLDDPTIKKTILDKAFMCVEMLPCTLKNLENRGLYTGPAGVGFMIVKLLQTPAFADHKSQFLDFARLIADKVLESCKKTRDDVDTCSLLLGRGGMYVICAAIYHILGLRKETGECVDHYYYGSTQCTPVDYSPSGGDEFGNGRAGYIAGALWLNRLLQGEAFPPELLEQVLESIVESGREHAKKKSFPCPLMYAYFSSEYIGALHGISSILLIILCFPNFLDRYPDVDNDVRATLDYILTLQKNNGNFPGKLDDAGRKVEEVIQWCNGAGGVIYLMAKGYLRYKDDKYKDSCLRCGEIIWRKGLLKKGPGLCHGIAGNAYAFLVLYRLTEDKKHLYRAYKFAEFIFTEEFEQSMLPQENPYSLFEGWAGVVCFLIDFYFRTKEAEFPFIPLFFNN